MALQNHPALYTGGSERVDSRPHTMLYAQLMQRKQARDDAYDDYIRNLNKGINPAGLRNVDRPAFEQKLKEWQQYGMQNKEGLRNPRKDNGGASMEFQARYQDLVNLINESKQEEEKKKPLVEIMTDPAKRDRLNEDELFPKINSHDQPLFTQDQKTGQWVRDANRRSFNVADLDFNPKPFEQDKYFKQFEDVKKTELPPVVTKNPKDMTQTEVKTSIYTPEDKDIIATRAVTDYVQNKSFKDVVDNLDPSEFNDFYKQNYGHDIQSPADLAAAYTLKGLQQKAVTTAVKDDIFARQKAMEAIRNANARGLVKLRDQLGDEDKALNDLWIDEYVDRRVEEARSKGDKKDYKYKDGTRVSGREVQIDPVMKKALGFSDKTKGTLIVTDAGDFIPVYYKTDDNYNPIKQDGSYAVDEELTNVIGQDQLKLALGKTSAGVKQTNMEMNQPSTQPKSGYANEQPATYKGKKITVGVKNGKWYNTQTGEEIK